MLNRKLLFFVTTILLLLLAGCSSSPKQPIAPHSDIVIKYSIRHFEMDLIQENYKVGQSFPDRSNLEQLLKTDFIRQLKENNLLAAENDINVVDLDIFVDYRRRFVGDLTPFPLESLAPPDVRLREIALFGNKRLRYDQSGLLSNKTLVFSTDSEKSIDKEQKNIIAISNTLIKRLKNRRQIDANNFAQHIKNLDASTIQARRASSENTLLSQPPILTKRTGISSYDYIPSDVIQSYILEVQSNDIKQRLNTYKKLSSIWVNNEELYNTIAANINQQLNIIDKASVNEMIEATKVLALSGLPQNKAVIKAIAENAASEDLKKYAAKATQLLSEREELAAIVHDTKAMVPELDWKSNQLINMLMSDNAKLRSYAIKDIYRTQLNNTAVLDVVSYQLEKESLAERFRTWKHNDFYAWSCRVLGSSGNKTYKLVLDTVATQAVNPKVRDYAKKFAKELK